LRYEGPPHLIGKEALIYRYTSLMLGVIIVAATDSFAKMEAQYDHNPPEIQAWYRAQINGQRVACCDQSDGHPYFGKYRLTADGGVELQLKGGPGCAACFFSQV
jgi:hypothetical protein